MIESDLLKHIYSRSALLRAFPQVLVGPGDDCAVVASPSGGQLLLTVDQLVEGRHFFPLGAAPSPDTLDLIARKAVARSISDIAAMGGSTLATLATACLPPSFPQAAADILFDRMNFWAAHFAAPLVGGDISQGPHAPSPSESPLVLTTTLIGVPHPIRGPILRSTARPGDVVFVTGRFGNSLASGRHLSFTPRIAQAAWLASLGNDSPTSMIDVSDGLGRDAGRIATASAVHLTIDAALVPSHADCPDWRRAIADGEDYELLFTLPPHVDPAGLHPPPNVTITRIGHVKQGPPTCSVRAPDGVLIRADGLGWDHGAA